MRAQSWVVVAAFAGGCATNTFRIPSQDLARLSQTDPAQRGRHVRVIQELSSTDVPTAQRVEVETEFVPNIGISVSSGPRPTTVRGGGGGLGGIRGGSGGDGKAAAIAVVVVAAVALVALAGVEGSRFDGYAQLHPMHPVHLIGHDGQYQVLPLAWIDPATAAATETAIVRPTEGPWQSLERAPLNRAGGYYGMFGGLGTMRSALGDLDTGTAFTIQAGVFPSQQIGIVGSLYFGWRNNTLGQTMFETRYMLELQAFPVVVGPLHLGLYGGGGLAYRFEDGIDGHGDAASPALLGGTMLQLDLNTRVALTARLGVTQAHDEYMKDVLIGLSVF